MVMHLTDDTYRKLCDGALPGAEARALALHLQQPCEACERYLSARSPADALDGRVDAALLALAPAPAAGRRDDLAYARLLRSLSAPRPRRWLPGVAAAAALAVAGLAALLRAPGPLPWDGEKGGAAPAVELRLRFLVVSPTAGGPPGIQHGISGQEAPAAASLQFEVELGRPAHVLLARFVSGAPPEVFFASRLGAGRQVVSLDGAPAAFPLASLSGPQRFLALASEGPIGAADAARSASSGSMARREGGQAISLDEVEVRVRP